MRVMRNAAATGGLLRMPHSGPTARRVILAAVCAVLLWAQHVAITHEMWHLLRSSGQAHAAALQGDNEQKSGSPQQELCALHAALSTVAGAMGCDGATYAPVVGCEVHVATIGALAPVGFPASPPARGPPQLL
jgi:hypothetical protein